MFEAEQLSWRNLTLHSVLFVSDAWVPEIMALPGRFTDIQWEWRYTVTPSERTILVDEMKEVARKARPVLEQSKQSR